MRYLYGDIIERSPAPSHMYVCLRGTASTQQNTAQKAFVSRESSHWLGKSTSFDQVRLSHLWSLRPGCHLPGTVYSCSLCLCESRRNIHLCGMTDTVIEKQERKTSRFSISIRLKPEISRPPEFLNQTTTCQRRKIEHG